MMYGTWLEIIRKRIRRFATKRPNRTTDVFAGLASVLLVLTVFTLGVMQVFAQGTRTTGCLAPGQLFHNPPELPSAAGILKGTIVLKEERQGLPESRSGNVTCAEDVRVRNFRGETAAGKKLDPMPAQLPHAVLSDPEPGPTLRARVGDLVQLTFVNEVNPNNFDPNIDFECAKVGKDGERYPTSFNDIFPNCLHASSTANVHFHGTHTNPNSTGDNVYLQVRPLPRDNQGNLTVTRDEATVGFTDFFKRCTEELQNPLNSWPATWDDLPKPWTDKQKELLLAHQQKYPKQRLWDQNRDRLKDDWPIYYIGAFPYCFALPDYVSPSGARPAMGQLPGTHWYHAHKHGSTAINVANGMTGAFIIEGKYDDDLNDAYRSYILERNGRKEAWNARSQPVLVLNQLATALNPTSGGGGDWNNLDFVVNGRVRPKLRMQPGEVQLWRIVNTSGRSAAYFMPPKGLKWMQLAQDGVQLEDSNFKQSVDRPFYLAPANRVDLLVQAPMQETSFDVLIQNVTARKNVDLAPAAQGTVLLKVEVAGPSVTQDDKPKQMPFLDKAFDLPEFIAKDIDEDELKLDNFTKRKFVFESKSPQAPVQHTINDIQFNEGHAHVTVLLSSVEEWTIENKTTLPIDHPFHIHINPFQVTEVFDPNEKFVSGKTGKELARYVIAGTTIDEPAEQCSLDPSNQATWKQCKPKKEKFVWHDVYAMPAARQEGSTVIPGHFKMRSRFVDYPGLYVMHCHILIHEDRGMMFSVQVAKAKAVPIQHH